MRPGDIMRAATGSDQASANLIASSYRDSGAAGGSAAAYFKLLATGMIAGGPAVVSGSGSYAWLTGGARTGLQVVVTLTSGAFSTGSGSLGAGTHNLDGGDLTFLVARSGAGTSTAVATFQIQHSSNPGVWLDEAEVTLTAFVEATGGGGGGGFGGGGGGGDIPN